MMYPTCCWKLFRINAGAERDMSPPLSLPTRTHLSVETGDDGAWMVQVCNRSKEAPGGVGGMWRGLAVAWLLLACVGSTGTPAPPRLSVLRSLRGIGGDGVEFEAGRVMARDAEEEGIHDGKRQRKRRWGERHVVQTKGAIGLGIGLRGGGNTDGAFREGNSA